MILRGNYSSEVLRTGANISFVFPDKKPQRLVFLLHGLHGDHGTWIDRTMLPVYAGEYDALFVVPEVGRSFYSDLVYGRKYFTYISEELPAICKKYFNFAPAREDTALMGCSMGAYGSLKLAFTYPERYGFCGAISPACLYFEWMLTGLRNDPAPYLNTGPEAHETLKDLYAIYGAGLEYNPDSDIVKLMYKISDPKICPKIYVTCGTEDSLYRENIKFREEIKTRPFDYTFEDWPGKHDWYFFSDALRKTLQVWYAGKN